MPRASSVSTSEPSGVSMDVLSLLRLLGRHWRVTAPAALLTVLGLVAALQFSSPTYEATGSIVLLSPPEPPEVNAAPGSAPAPDVGQNPFARYDDLAVVSDIIARVMDSDSKRAEFESQGVTDYDVAANRLERGPVVEVTGQGPSSEAAIQSTEIVLAEVDAVLSELQKTEGADPEYFINSAPLEPPSTATAMYGSTVRVAIAALAVGAVCMFGLAVLAEAIARRWTVQPPAAAGPILSDSARVGGEAGAANGSHKADWSAILPALQLARRESSKQESASQEPAQQEPAQEARAQEERAKQEPAWLEPAQQEASRQEPAQPESAQHEPARHEAAQRKPARSEPEQQESAWHGMAQQGTAQQESTTQRKSGPQAPSKQKSARRSPARQKPSTQDSAWEESFQMGPPNQESASQKGSSEFPADNGHRRPTTDRSP
jgi:hypothetical protein